MSKKYDRKGKNEKYCFLGSDDYYYETDYPYNSRYLN